VLLVTLFKAWVNSLGKFGTTVVDMFSRAMFRCERKMFLWASVLRSPAGQRGAVDPAGMMLMAIGLIFLSVGMIIYPICFDATDAVFAWTSANYTAGPPQVGYTTADFTGLNPILGIFPLLVLLGYVVEAVINGIMGIQVMRGQSAGGINPAGLMLQSIGLIFLSVAMIVYPITLDGIAAILDGLAGATGTYTGIGSFAPVVPLLVLLAIIIAGVMVSFFGIKTQWKSVKGESAATA
jgi:hypothetical protein